MKETSESTKESQSEPEILSVSVFDSIIISDSFISELSLEFIKQIFSEETMESLRELGQAYASIRSRLISEGYEIINGEVYKNGIKIEKRRGKKVKGDPER